MEQQDRTLPLEWLSSRRTPELHRLEQLCRESAREQRCAQRRLQEVEEAMAPEAEKIQTDAVPDPSDPRVQLEQMSRRLNVANAELRRYETRMFAYERTMLALRKENAELTTQCEELRKELEQLADSVQWRVSPPQETGEEAQKLPELPVIQFPPDPAAKRPSAGKAAEKPAPKRPRTKLEDLSQEVLGQLARLMPEEKQE